MFIRKVFTPEPGASYQRHELSLTKDFDIRCDAARSMMITISAMQLALDGDERYTPRRLATYCCDMANALYDEFDNREWIQDIPLPARVGGGEEG